MIIASCQTFEEIKQAILNGYPMHVEEDCDLSAIFGDRQLMVVGFEERPDGTKKLLLQDLESWSDEEGESKFTHTITIKED